MLPDQLKAYLPQALDSYLAVPRAFAERRPVAGGRTPHDVLLEQLDLMDRKMQEVADDIARHDSDRLLANGRFLAERFSGSSLRIDAADAPVAVSVSPPSPATAANPVAVATQVQAAASHVPADARQRVVDDEREHVH